MALIPRNDVIQGAVSDSFTTFTRDVEPFPVREASVTLTRSQLHAINTTPREVLAAPDTGAANEIVSLRVQKGAAAFTTATPLQFRYGSSTGNEYGRVATAEFTGAASDNFADPAAPAAAVPTTGALIAFSTANFAGAGADVVVTVRYLVIAL